MNTYYYENRELILARRAEYYKQNKEYIKERNKNYFKEYYYRNQQKMITRSIEYQKKQRYNRLEIIKSKPIFDNTLKIIEIKPMLNLKFDDEFILDLTEY